LIGFFLNELQRRHVVKVALLYIVSSWVILQAADVLFPFLRIDDWAFGLLLGLLLLFFVPALIFSWVYEMTPEGLKREKDVDHGSPPIIATAVKLNKVIVVLLAVAIFALALNRFVPEIGSIGNATPIGGIEAIAAVAGDRSAVELLVPVAGLSIAVLPFINMTDDPRNENFSDGISEQVLKWLANIPELRVTSRTSTFALRGNKSDTIELAHKLNVANILEGSVQRSGDHARITVQLISTNSDQILWSESYDRSMDDIFLIQDEIAADIASKVEAALLGIAPLSKVGIIQADSLDLRTQSPDSSLTPEPPE
jgi:TolB-like protein